MKYTRMFPRLKMIALRFTTELDGDWFIFLEQPINILTLTLVITKPYVMEKHRIIKRWYPMKKITKVDILILTGMGLFL